MGENLNSLAIEKTTILFTNASVYLLQGKREKSATSLDLVYSMGVVLVLSGIHDHIEITKYRHCINAPRWRRYCFFVCRFAFYSCLPFMYILYKMDWLYIDNNEHHNLVYAMLRMWSCRGIVKGDEVWMGLALLFAPGNSQAYKKKGLTFENFELN